MDKWKIVHSYRSEAQKGSLVPWYCPVNDCGAILVSVIDEDNDEQPMLRCFVCDTNYHLTDDFFEEMENLVNAVS